jgi:CDP-glycerol glycerophosphotransferase
MVADAAPAAGAPSLPDVTVIVIGYNDAARLPVAVRSVLDQTLRNLECVIVDDASTDGMGDVARGLAEAHPDRVRVLSLPENSGGCSRPRNAGLELARAPYVMFLDSDDTLERHACKNLLLAAERHDADLVSGVCVRVLDGRAKRRRRWLPDLYQTEAVFQSIRENPDLMMDTLCTNKLYRREFLDREGIRFPEGLHYEDLLFTAEAYCSARRIAVIPVEVYRWMVMTDTDEESIHRRRGDLRNFLDRLTIHRAIDAYLHDHGHDDLRIYKDRKFLKSDLRLYLGELSFREPEYQQGWLEAAAEYLETFSPGSLRSAGRLPHAATFLIRVRDLPAVLDVARLWATGRLSQRLVVRDGHAYLTDRHLDSDEAREALDVTPLHLHDAPFSALNVDSVIDDIRVAGGMLRLRGRIVRQAAIDVDDPLAVIVSFRDRRTGRRVDRAADDVALDDGGVTWRAEVPLAELPALASRQPYWRLWTMLTWRSATNLSSPTIARSALPKGRWRSGALVRLTEEGAAADVRAELLPGGVRLFVRTSRGRGRRRGGRRLARVQRRWQRVLRLAQSERVKAKVAHRVFRWLPVRPRTVVFESHVGRSYSDSPKYVYEALVRAGIRHRAIWSSAGGSSKQWPAEATVVRRGSWRYWYELSRAGYWVDNQGFPAAVTPRRTTTYLQTWHGTPLKLMGYDSPRLELGPASDRARFARGVGRWTDLTVQGAFEEEVFADAFRHRARVLRTGLPRNERLCAFADNPDEQVVRDLKDRLELPQDRRIILYAPTFRDYLSRTKRFEPPFRLHKLREEAGYDWFLMIRAHYLDKIEVRSRHQTFARDVSRHPDITDLLLVADGLITDYSSVMFDFALLRRPMLFLVPDYRTYEIARGTYFDLHAVAPGPLVTTESEVAAWLTDPDAAHREHAARYKAFVERFCGYATANASDAVVDQVFERLR